MYLRVLKTVNVNLMTKTFMMKLNEIHPSQLYISSEKLYEVMKTFNPSKPDQLNPYLLRNLEARSFLWTVIPELLLLSYMTSPRFLYIGKTMNLTGMLMKSV